MSSTHSTAATSTGVDDLAAVVTSAISKVGIKQVAAVLGLDEGTTMRVALGSTVRRASLALAKINAPQLRDLGTSKATGT